MTRTRVIVGILLWLGGCLITPLGHGRDTAAAQTASEAGQTFFLHTDDNAQATTELLTFLQQNHFEVHRQNQRLLIVQYEGQPFVLELRGKKGEVSLVMVSRPFMIAPEYRTTLEVRAWVNQSNHRIGFLKFSLSDQGDTLVMQGYVTFVDQLEAQHVRKFLELFNDALRTMVETMPEARQYLK